MSRDVRDIPRHLYPLRSAISVLGSARGRVGRLGRAREDVRELPPR
jgi:hypothetical protein